MNTSNPAGFSVQNETQELTLRAVQQAALAASKWVGKQDGYAADHAATEAMRQVFDGGFARVRVVIGEGERDQAPMLFRGEELGSPKGQALDCAVDPCDGTSLVKAGRGGGLTLAALAERDGLLGAPDTYMEKLVLAPAAKGAVQLSQPTAERVQRLSQALKRTPEDLRIAVQRRKRHDTLVQELRLSGVEVDLFDEGDVAVALHVMLADGKWDALMGIGAAPEGVISAAMAVCLGADFQGRFAYDPEEVMSGLIGTCRESNREQLVLAGIADPDHHFMAEEFVRGQNVVVGVCGVTSGTLLKGVNSTSAGELETESLLLTSGSSQPKKVQSIHAAESLVAAQRAALRPAASPKATVP